VTGTYDPDTNQTIRGTGNPVPMFDPTYRPGDNLYTNSAISWDPDTGKMNWYFQFTPGDMWDYDEVGTHILIDDVVAAAASGCRSVPAKTGRSTGHGSSATRRPIPRSAGPGASIGASDRWDSVRSTPWASPKREKWPAKRGC
jgi:hypothetical protein